MPKKKNPKGKPVYKKKSKTTQLIVVVIILAFAGYMVYSNFLISKSNSGERRGNMTQGVYNFKKEGDLTFTNSDGNYKSKIDIEIAADEEARLQGMMYRAEMKEDQGMFFIFPYENFQSFWMRNTMLPLDILFVNSNLEIVTIHKNAKPFDEGSYGSTEVAQYVVEVNTGYCDRHDIQVGDKIVWRRN